MRLFLVDSSIFIFRAWYGPEPERVNLQQQPNQAFIGFSDFVYRLLTEQAPSHLVFAFDESRSSCARKSIYAEYKANRSPAPQDLRRQFAWCRQWLEVLGISCVSSKQWEADDLIGSLRHYHASAQLPAIILTADKDLAQLIGEHDLWWSYFDDVRLDYRAITRKFGVCPQQIAEQLALTGDKVDNIPGIPGIGEKTAKKLVREYGSVEGLIEHAEELKGKQKERSKVINEHGVNITFTKIEGKDGEYKVDGKGTNQFGIFHINGTATPSSHDGDPTYSILLRKRYEPIT